MAEIEKVRYRCKKVLPAIYDDSLSYYEVLCKVQKKLNEIIDTVNRHSEILENLGEYEERIQALEDLAVEHGEMIEQLGQTAQGLRDDVEEIKERIEIAPASVIRLVYTDGTSVTKQDVEDFVIEQGLDDEEKWYKIEVVIQGNSHVWKYVEGSGEYEWVDAGLDNVNVATASTAGIVKASGQSGQITVNANGVMSLNGYSAIISGLNGKVDSSHLVHETRTWVLPNSSEVTEEVVLWQD